MHFSQKNKNILIGKGLPLVGEEHDFILVKEIGIEGNQIPNYFSMSILQFDKDLEIQNELISDCPIMDVKCSSESIILSCWEWIPGPGPGDFELAFTDEEKAMEFILSYYFGENSYFEARKSFEENRTNKG